MDYRAEILEEIRNLSPVIANIQKKNVYTYPHGYFDGLPERVCALTSQPESDFLANKKTPYSVPPNYFETLSAQIMAQANLSKDVIAEELLTIAPFLNTIERKNVWHVTPDYFSGFNNDVLKKINGHQLDLAHQQNSFNLSQSESSEVRLELDSIAPTLNQINRQTPLTLPRNYFANFAVNPKVNKPAVLITMFSKVSQFTKYAAAAVIGALLLTGGFLFVNKSSNQSGEAISSKHSQINEYTPEAIESLTDQEIKEYLSTNGSNYTSPVIWDESEVEELMHQMTEEEIKQYLKENSEPSDLHSKEG